MYRAPTRRDNGKWAWVRGRMPGRSSDSATKFSEQSKYLILLPLAPFEVLSKFALHFVCGHPS